MDSVVIRTLAGLAVVGALATTRALWPWGLATLAWVVYTVFYGTTYVVEPVNRSTHPKLYWFVTAVWAVTALLMVVEDFPR